MLVAVLDAQGNIIGIEDITQKGVDEGYRPKGITVNAQPDWEQGGKVVGGVYTPPPAIDFGSVDDAEINRLLMQPGSVVRALATVVFKDMKSRTPSLTLAQFKAMLKNEMR